MVIHSGLGVIALFKATTRDRHDAGFFIGEVNLILCFRGRVRCLGCFASGLLPNGFPFRTAGYLLVVQVFSFS